MANANQVEHRRPPLSVPAAAEYAGTTERHVRRLILERASPAIASVARSSSRRMISTSCSKLAVDRPSDDSAPPGRPDARQPTRQPGPTSTLTTTSTRLQPAMALADDAACGHSPNDHVERRGQRTFCVRHGCRCLHLRQSRPSAAVSDAKSTPGSNGPRGGVVGVKAVRRVLEHSRATGTDRLVLVILAED